ncbi:MAG: fumarylacetoacetate hydrolase family protein [Marinobacterium sp.]|nr:fumarylacetoacetate hydrolase family protein [Marinobacterium sp.]
MTTDLNSTASSKWVCVALNDLQQLNSLQAEFNEAPYKQPPTQPVLYFKPRNTWGRDGAVIEQPASEQLVVGASIAVMIGQECCRVSEQQALDYVAGYRLLHDFSLPEQSYYRPDIKGKCLDNSAPLSEAQLDTTVAANPSELTVVTSVNGEQKAALPVTQLHRNVQQLIATISRIMTLQPGDLIAVGFPGDRIPVQPGDQVKSEIIGASESVILQNSIGEGAA